MPDPAARPLILGRELIATPIGVIVLLTDEQGRIRTLDWDDHQERTRRLLRLHYGDGGVSLGDHGPPSAARAALEAYFAGDLHALDDLEVETAGTPFQRVVWAALRRIPVGATLTYGALAAKIGRPSAVRAVGLANGANPIGVVAPCHRVIGADGSLTGYGGGLPRKRWLLEHEGAKLRAD
ncbi:MAG TPA: methylated-DNA--[protein]-cysteine S-methyltransferase [Caulobacteraceae bacterium]|jgi:methylated-DNA-[protein]-cysteine S-methyltransferase|nr:methylated-DNA--[protein]-cysteine S-methyltransferase [Caulobacteraceae bacterium]